MSGKRWGKGYEVLVHVLDISTVILLIRYLRITDLTIVRYVALLFIWNVYLCIIEERVKQSIKINVPSSNLTLRSILGQVDCYGHT